MVRLKPSLLQRRLVPDRFRPRDKGQVMEGRVMMHVFHPLCSQDSHFNPPHALVASDQDKDQSCLRVTLTAASRRDLILGSERWVGAALRAFAHRAVAATTNLFPSEIRFVPFGPGQRRKFNG